MFIGLIFLGIISGYLASSTTSGFLSGYISYFLASLFSIPGLHNLQMIIFWALSFPLLAGIIGAIIGYYTDSLMLKVMQQKGLQEIQEEEIEETGEIIELSDEELRELSGI